MPINIRDEVAVVGVGKTAFRPFGEGASDITLVAEALQLALDDAGIQKDQIDGLIGNWLGGTDFDQYAANLGLSLRFCDQTWKHGRFTNVCFQHAALAVAADLADFVVLVGVMSSRPPAFSDEASRPGGGPHGEVPYYGFMSHAEGAAMALRRYLHITGADRSSLGEVVTAMREHASKNPKAALREPLSRSDYDQSPMEIEPLRLADYFHSAAGATCVIVTSLSKARGLKHDPIYVMGMQGMQVSKEEYSFARPGMGVIKQSSFDFQPTSRDLRVFERSGITQSDVDGFYTYDSYSPQIWYALERFGYCDPGEAWRWATAERIGPGGELPINTHGGSNAEGMTVGWGHIVEMVEQLRHACGSRQIPDARILQFTHSGDSIILTNEAK